MINTTRILSAALLVLAGVSGVHASDTNTADRLKIYDMSVKVNDRARTLGIDIALDLKRFSVPSEREMILTPVLIASTGKDSLVLDTIRVAGRNRWFHYLRDGGEDYVANNHIYKSGANVTPHYTAHFDLEPWMEHSSLEMRTLSANCCDDPVLLKGKSPRGYVPLADIDVRRADIDAPYVFAPPVDAAPVKKSLQGKAFITFVVNRTELKPDYMVNPRELKKIIASIDTVRNDPDANFSGVHIKGFASPEGPYSNNVRLAAGRTETLRRYVRDLYHFNDTIITSDFEPEDWAGLRSYVRDSLDYPIQNREQILSVIDSSMEPDAKDQYLRTTFPEDYAVILRDIYPWLRHSDYTVRYTVKIFTSLADLRRVYASDPTRLRPVDFFTIAQALPQGSPEYVKVIETAVSVYPDDPMLNLNAANIEMEKGELDKAQSHLLKSGNTPVSNYARGILAAHRGDLRGAISFFEKAKAGGVSEAGQALERATIQLNADPVTYLMKTTGQTEK